MFAALGLLAAEGFVFPCSSGIEAYHSPKASLFDGVLFVVSFGSLFSEIFKQREKFSLAYGFVFWLFFFIGALYWLVYPLTIDLSLHWILIPFALVAIPAYLSIPLLFPIYITRRLYKNIWVAAFAFATLNFFVMYFFGHYAPGFPWALPGYVWSGSLNIMQALSIWGIYGQTFFTLLMGSIFGVFAFGCRICSYISEEKLHEMGLKRYGFSLVIIFVSFLSIFVFGNMRLSKNPTECIPYKIRCVQGSIHQKDKMNKSLSAHNFNLYLNLSRIKSERGNWNPDFVIWPEASIPYLFTDKSKVLSEKLADVVPHDGYLLSGAVRKDSSNGDIYNSIIVLDEFGKNVQNYDKKHLVPFGEYIPFRRFIPEVFAPIANSIGDFAVGRNSNIMDLGGLKIALTICYEAIFSGEFISNEDTGVDVIVNVTNDAWFGHTSELVQHLNIVRARAIEEGIPLIRVTNFGISAVFDAYGRKMESLNTDKIGVIDCYIPKKIKKTFFRKFFMDKMK